MPICGICEKQKWLTDSTDKHRKKKNSATICEICGKQKWLTDSTNKLRKKKSATICEICGKQNGSLIAQINTEKKEICDNLRNLREIKWLTDRTDKHRKKKKSAAICGICGKQNGSQIEQKCKETEQFI